MDIPTSTRQRLQEIGEFLGLCIVIALGFFGWVVVSAGASWLASAFGRGLWSPQMYAFLAFLALYVFIVISIFRRWRESRRLVGIPKEMRSEYLRTAWSLPLQLIGTLGIVGALFLWGWQVLYWLKADIWVSLDIVSLVTPIDGEPLGPRTLFGGTKGTTGKYWLISPDDWYGLHKIVHFTLSWVTPSLLMLVGGVTALDKGSDHSDVRLQLTAQSNRLSQVAGTLNRSNADSRPT